MRFEWDPNKAVANWKKHRVSFEEARTVFEDELSAILPDEDHSVAELRWLALGMSRAGRVLTISFAERDGAIRIISARTASKKEIKNYES